jgi:alginate biosynthesis protein AlgX
VIVPNVLGYAVSSQFDEPFFEPRDHHWSVAGARIAAYALADALARQPEWADLPKGTYESAESGDSFVLNETFSGIMQDICDVEFPERRIPIWSTHASGVENVSAESLFGDAGPSPVVIAGTSMSNKNGTDDFNFGGFFAEYSGVMPLNVGIDGGGTEEAILAYLRGDGFASAPPRFLVWEMPGYYDLNSEAMLREAMAAVGGDCADDAAIASAEVPAAAGEVALFDTLPAGIVPEETYVSLHFSDLDLRRVDFRFAYDGGDERLKAERSGRGPRDGRFLMAADPSRTGALESVTLELPDDAKGTVDARLCRFAATPG